MKRVVLYLLLAALCPCACFATLGDADDGFLTEGEYDYGVWLENEDELIVMGGGADVIVVKDYSYLEVQYTSTPLSNSSGIYDILLDDYSELLYLGGITEEITLYDDATALLKGGRIDGITLYCYPNYSPLVTIYCQAGYQMNQSGISGLWQDGTAFNTQFINVGSPYPPTADYVNVVEVIPEPATILLFGIGGLLLRRKRRLLLHPGLQRS